MADRRILEKYRKPRQTRGTPFHRHRNYLTLAVFGFSGLCLALYELSPVAKKLRAKQYSGYFDDSPELQARNQIIQLSRNNPSLEHVFTKARH